MTFQKLLQLFLQRAPKNFRLEIKFRDRDIEIRLIDMDLRVHKYVVITDQVIENVEPHIFDLMLSDFFNDQEFFKLPG